MKHEIEFTLTGNTMTAITDRLAEIANGFFGVGEWDYEMQTLVPASPVGETMSYTNPRFTTTVRVWETT
jgi:hypothetical protein